jgi:hypothetical protein
MNEVAKTKLLWNCTLCDMEKMTGEEAEAHLHDHFPDVFEEDES